MVVHEVATRSIDDPHVGTVICHYGLDGHVGSGDTTGGLCHVADVGGEAGRALHIVHADGGGMAAVDEQEVGRGRTEGR